MVFRLKYYRVHKKLSRRELAELSGVNEQTIVALENNKTDVSAAKLDTLIKLARALKCKVRDFYPDERNI